MSKLFCLVVYSCGCFIQENRISTSSVYVVAIWYNFHMQCHYIVVAMMNRDEAEAARHAAFLDKQERVFHKRQQVIWRFIAFSTTPMVGHKDDSLAGSLLAA